MTTRAASALRATTLAAVGLLASGCATFSPVQTEYDYPAADGVRFSMEDLELRNLAVVAAEENGPGVVIGQAVNPSAAAVDVSFSVEGSPAPVETTVPANSGDGLPEVALESVPAPPGATIELTVTTPKAGQNVVRVPVLGATGYYEGLVTPSS